jgi:hypothetical protein
MVIYIPAPARKVTPDALKNLKIKAKFTSAINNTMSYIADASQCPNTSFYEFTHYTNGLSSSLVGASSYQISVDVNLIFSKINFFQFFIFITSIFVFRLMRLLSPNVLLQLNRQ